MKLSIFLLALSMTAVFPLVNASSEDLPIRNSSQSDKLKDSTNGKDTKTEFTQIVDFLFKTGSDGQIGGGLTGAAVGLPNSMPAKHRLFAERNHGKDKFGHHCFLVYETVPDASPATERRPVCLYIMTQKISKHNRMTQYFRVGLDGRLEKAVTISGELDDSGKGVPGSGRVINLNTESSETQKIFSSEWTQMRTWLRKQKKLAPKDKLRGEVRASAAAESAALDKEAAPASATSPAP